jgi:diaminopimelate epimerase
MVFTMKFHKYHALGNDYIVLDPYEWTIPLDPSVIRRLCHRNFGIGSDGILYGPISTKNAEFAQLAGQVGMDAGEDVFCGLRIFNPDGGEAEKSGNGLRIFSRYLLDSGRVKSETPFGILTLGGRVEATVLDAGAQVRVSMGRVSFDADDVPVTGYQGEVLEQSIAVGGEALTFSAATVGNPHCVVLADELSADLAKQFGPPLETHPVFPNRTNVQFMKVLDRHTVAIEIWERGAGYTLASGSSASACAAISKKLGLTDSPITVKMPGGELNIDVSDAFDIVMQGPVTRVADGTYFLFAKKESRQRKPEADPSFREKRK